MDEKVDKQIDVQESYDRALEIAHTKREGKRQRRHNVIMSACVLAACFVLLCGSSLAWFTSSAGNTSNQVGAGTLGVTLTCDGVSSSSENPVVQISTEAITCDASTAAAAFATKEITVTNNGSLGVDVRLNVWATNQTWVAGHAGTAADTALLDAQVVKNDDDTTKKDINGVELIIQPGGTTTVELTAVVPASVLNRFDGQNIDIVLTASAKQQGNDSDYGSVTVNGIEHFLIYSKADWNIFANMVKSGTTFSGKKVMLVGDVNLGRFANADDACIGAKGKVFQGTLDGNGHTVTVGVAGEATYALTWYVNAGAKVCNVAYNGLGSLKYKNQAGEGVIAASSLGAFMFVYQVAESDVSVDKASCRVVAGSHTSNLYQMEQVAA